MLLSRSVFFIGQQSMEIHDIQKSRYVDPSIYVHFLRMSLR